MLHRRLCAALLLIVALTAGCARTTSTAGHPVRAARDTAWAPPPDPHIRVRMTSYLYSGREHVYVHWVSGRRNAPWVVFVHGGGWYTGSSDAISVRALAAIFADDGFQFFGVDYRLTEVARWPAQRQDIAAAVAWIRARAAWWGLDLGRGVILGESAGGQLAAIEGSVGHFAAVVSLAGVLDPLAALTAPDATLRRSAAHLVGCLPRVCPAVWRDTRAAGHIGPSTPSTLLVHAVHDPVAPVAMSQAYAAALRAAGRPVTLDVVPGTSHAVIYDPGVLQTVLHFVTSAA